MKLALSILTLFAVALVSADPILPFIPMNFTANLEYLFPVGLNTNFNGTIHVNQGYLGWDYQVIPSLVVKDVIFALEKGMDFYIDQNMNSYYYFNKNNTCMKIYSDYFANRYFWALITSSWLNTARYVGVPPPRSYFYMDTESQPQMWASTGNASLISFVGSFGGFKNVKIFFLP